MVTVSVITPAFNAAKTIRETIESVLAQSFSDFEYIIVDDGSTDDTLEIIRQFSDSRLRVISQQNSGPQKSRNRGIKNALGTYISFIDADDLWSSNKLELQIEALKNNPEATVVYSWTDVIDEKTQVYRRGGYAVKEGDVFVDLLLGNFVENGSNFLTTLEAINSVGGFDESIVAGQDRDILLSLASRYSFIVVPEVQIYYRKPRKSQSWSSSIQRAQRGIEQVLDKHLSNKDEFEKYRQISMSNSCKYLLFECLNTSPNRDKALYAIKILATLLRYDKQLITQKVFWKVCLRILALVMLPNNFSGYLMKQFSYFFDITTLYGYLVTKVPSGDAL